MKNKGKKESLTRKQRSETSAAPAAAPVNKVETRPVSDLRFAFGKENYRLMLLGLAVLALGFLLMIGGGSKDPNVFNEKMFGFQRLTLAPLLILAGYVIEVFAILKRPKD